MSADGGNSPTTPAHPASVAPAAAPAPAPAAPAAPVAEPRRRRGLRYLIMAAVPLALAIGGGYLWLTGGRYLSTDNAYVQQDRVTISPQVTGRIVSAPVRENDVVAAGDVLFVVDQAPYRIALASAEAGLASARLQVDQLRSALQVARGAVAAATDDVDFKQRAFDRQMELHSKGIASQATYDQADAALHAAQQTLAQAKERADSALAGLGGDPAIATDQHPLVLAALARRDQAAQDLANTTVTAPAAGVVAQADRLVVGQQVGPSVAVMSLIETGASWIEANFKETDLTKMVPGQAAKVTIDAYPGRELTGEVAGIGAGTGAEFSLLPAQNATGNWVKVVQRVPVHIRITEALDGLTLRTGLSASVTVDTGGGAGSAFAADR